jgi:uncharacterized protein YecE (DUF72 family)
VKAWQEFTHKKGLWRPVDVLQFKSGIQPLADAGKLGGILFQFPASFRKSPETFDQLKTMLDQFEGFAKAVELRHNT